MIQISYWINLISCNCVIAELLTKCRHFGFWQNVFSCFTVLITVLKGSTYVSACTVLLSALVLQFETLRALTIMLKVKGVIEEWNFRSYFREGRSYQRPLDHMVCHKQIFFWALRLVVGPTIFHKILWD